jgi:hypothetical protein
MKREQEMAGRLYLTALWDQEKGAYVAVVTEGHASAGDTTVTCCTVSLQPTERACRQWFKRMRKERPWEARH